MKIKTGDLSGVALDWAVGVAIGHRVQYSDNVSGLSIAEPYSRDDRKVWAPSTDWSQGGPLIERFSVGFGVFNDEWLATEGECSTGCGVAMYGSTHLIAACRAIVAAKLGDEVDVPEGLV